MFIADCKLEAGDYLDGNTLHNSFTGAASEGKEMLLEGNDDDGVVYIYQLTLVGKVTQGKPVVEKICVSKG